MARPARRPTPSQLSELSHAATKALLGVLDAWPLALRRMEEYRPGPHAAALAPIGGGHLSDPTARAALTVEPDVNVELREWLERKDQLLAILFAQDAEARRLLGPFPPTQEESGVACHTSRFVDR